MFLADGKYEKKESNRTISRDRRAEMSLCYFKRVLSQY
jgi:hypothetical protein